MKTQSANRIIPLFDLHCDTISELYNKKLSFDNDILHISKKKTKDFAPYTQVCAIWSDYRLSEDSSFENYQHCLKYYRKKLHHELQGATIILSVEDGKLLNNDLSRLFSLIKDGIKILTLCWKGQNCIGGGWDTSFGLSNFGYSVVTECSKNNITIDLSHSSFATQADVMNLSQKLCFKPIFSHSNSFSLCSHYRNVCDEMFKEIVGINSIVGISLFTEHLSFDEHVSFDDIFRHIDYFLSLGGENNISLGCDFDGINALPKGINSIYDLHLLYEEMTKTFGEAIAYKIFYGNAFNYFKNLVSKEE